MTHMAALAEHAQTVLMSVECSTMTISHGLCGCGCGAKTKLVTHTDARRGITQGEYRRYVPGHVARLRSPIAPVVSAPQRPGWCDCGCGGRTTLVTRTDTRRGLTPGAYHRYVRGHAARVFSDETKEKIAASLRGRTVPPDVVAKSIAGRTGLKRTPEQRARIAASLKPGREARGKAISAAKKGKAFTAAHRAAMSAAFTGRVMSAATRQKMSASKQGHATSQATRAKIGAANTGKQRTMEQRAAMSQARTAAVLSPETREKHRAAKQQWWASLTPADRQVFVSKRGDGLRRHWAAATTEQRRAWAAKTVAGRQAAGITTKAKWARMSRAERFARMRPLWQASQSANPSSIEETVAAVLDALGVAYCRQKFIGRHLVDFYVRSKKLVIECDGSYWHNLPGRPESDARRDAWFASHGYAVLRLKEKDIKAGLSAEQLAAVI